MPSAGADTPLFEGWDKKAIGLLGPFIWGVILWILRGATLLTPRHKGFGTA
jgi:hypothetical protein